MLTGEISIKTHARSCLVDITDQLQRWIEVNQCQQGHLIAFVPHTTAGLTINENADPDVQTDLLEGLSEMVPRGRAWRHEEGNSDAHLRSSLMGASLPLIVTSCRIQLGRWQAIFFSEGDGPRTRTIWLSFQGEIVQGGAR